MIPSTKALLPKALFPSNTTAQELSTPRLFDIATDKQTLYNKKLTFYDTAD
jgi:hypothetical protein